MVHIRPMNLADYMAREGLTDAALAAKIGVAGTTVLRWRRGDTRPDWDALPAIVAATDGAVTANDFMPAAPEASQ